MDQQKDLTQLAGDFIAAKKKIRLIDETIKDLESRSTLKDEIEEAKTKLKDLKSKRNLEINELDELKEQKAEQKDTVNLLAGVIGARMKKEIPTLEEDMGIPSIRHDGYKFMLRDKLVIKRDKEA